MLKASEQGKNAQKVCRTSPINGNYLLTDYTANYRRSNRKTKQKSTREIYALKKDFQTFGLPVEKAVVKKKVFQYPITTLLLSLANIDGLLRQQKNKAAFRHQIIKVCPLSKPNIARTNIKWINDRISLFRNIAPQQTYRDWLKFAAKTIAKHSHQNQAINIEIVNYQNLVSRWHQEWYTTDPWGGGSFQKS